MAQISRLESSEILHTLTAANSGACMTVKKIKRLLDEGGIFPSAYASLLLQQVGVCKAQTKKDEFRQLCEQVAKKLQVQV